MRYNTIVSKYALGGFLFGLCFPLGAIFFDLFRLGMSFSLTSILKIHEAIPIHYVIDSAPFILCLVAYIIGKVAYNDQVELKRLYEKLNHSTNQLSDSIKYAKTIQDAVLIRHQSIQTSFSSAFVHCKPKDTIGGDYIWHMHNSVHGLGLVDCVGHGIPGAMMTMIANFLMQDICKEESVDVPDHFFESLDKRVLNIFKTSELRNGMDFSILCFNKEFSKVTFSGANQSMIIIRGDRSVELIKGVRRSIGDSFHKNRQFHSHVLEVSKGDKFMLYSDGLVDQFNSLDNEKFGQRRLLKLIEKSSHLTANSLGEKILWDWEKWKGTNIQTDDNSFVVVEI